MIGDLGGCYKYRLDIPHTELRRYNVSTFYSAFMPNRPGVNPNNQFKFLIDQFSKYDLVIIQRCYLPDIVQTMRMATEFIGIPLLFEVDDLYTGIPDDNPAYLSMVPKDIVEAGDREAIEKKRIEGLVSYVQILGMMDGIICSTEELANNLRVYNKNVFVLENNLEQVGPYKALDPEHMFLDANGNVKINETMGMITVPGFVQVDEENFSPTPRIGYTSTITHWGRDFNSIVKGWEKVIEKYAQSCWFVYIGWERFARWHMEFAGMRWQIGQELIPNTEPPLYRPTGEWVPDETKRQLPRRLLHIPESSYEYYMFHIRNLDIGMAPLAANQFNMAKSDLKAIEYGSWGVPAVLPRLITYSRHWVDGENCLMYSNAQEFQSVMDLMINDHALREQLGKAAYKYVSENRLEKFHSYKRYLIYRAIINSKRRLPEFIPVPKELPIAA